MCRGEGEDMGLIQGNSYQSHGQDASVKGACRSTREIQNIQGREQEKIENNVKNCIWPRVKAKGPF